MNFSIMTLVLAMLLGLVSRKCWSQDGGENLRRTQNPAVAVPFLLINPIASVGGMGNAGVALIQPDLNSAATNISSLAFIPKGEYGFSISYSPWMQKLISDMHLSYASGFVRMNDRNTLAFSVRYFSMGLVQTGDSNHNDFGLYQPNEFSADVNYARSFGPNFALGGGIRFINSNLYTGQLNASGRSQAFSADISMLYKKSTFLLGNAATWSLGANITNIGTKMNYSAGGIPYFLPANLRIGSALSLGEGGEERVIMAFDVNKVLVPRQPVIGDSEGTYFNQSVPSSILSSFSGSELGFLGELSFSFGLQYSFSDQLKLRGGYNYQNPEIGNSRYFTFGFGTAYKKLGFDFSYLVSPVNQNPLSNTLRLTLNLSFDQPQSKGR